MTNEWEWNEAERDPRRFTSDAAFTAPAEEERRRRQGRKRVVLCTVLCLIFLFLLFGILYISLSGVLDEEERGLSRLLGTRVELSEEEPAPETAGEVLSAEETARPEPAPLGGDTRIALSSDGRRGESLSAEELYRSCAPSVVSVLCFDGSGSLVNYGSGVIVSAEGSIVTNAHLLGDAASVSVCLWDGSELPAALAGSDDASGLAVLRVEAEGLQEAELADLSSVETGSAVIAIGSALPGSLSVSDGLVSAKEVAVRQEGFRLTALETTAYGGAGFSGGAVFNEFGQVIGILNAELTARYDLGKIALAVPMSVVKSVAEELLEKGYVSGRPSVGVQLSDIPPSAAAFYGLPAGVFVESVFTGAEAYEKGISRGDILVSADGIEISSVAELNAVLDRHAVGDSIVLGVYRDREVWTVEVRLIDLNAMMHE